MLFHLLPFLVGPYLAPQQPEPDPDRHIVVRLVNDLGAPIVGQGLDACEIRRTKRSSHIRGRAVSRRTNAFGEAAFPPRDLGRWTLRATLGEGPAGLGHASKSSHFDLATDGSPGIETLVIPRLGALPIRLHGPGPFADVTCAVSGATYSWVFGDHVEPGNHLYSDPAHFPVTVDDSGRWIIDRLSAGTFEVTVARGTESTTFEVTVEPGQVLPERDVQWEAKAEWIQGVATYADGRPFVGGFVMASPVTLNEAINEDSLAPWCEVDSRGRFCLAKRPGVLYCVGLMEPAVADNSTWPGATVDCQLAWPGAPDGPPIQLSAPPGMDGDGADDPENVLECPRPDTRMTAWSRNTELAHPFHPASLEIHGQHAGRPVLGTVTVRHESGRLTNVDCDDGKPFHRDDLEAGTYEIFINQLACGDVELAAGESKRLDLDMPVALPVLWHR